MSTSKFDIIQQLQKDIMPLQGYKPSHSDVLADLGLGPLEKIFPQGVFPRGTIHDLLSISYEQAAATTAFIAVILGKLMQPGGVSVWIGSPSTTFAPGLAAYGLDPHRIIFISPPNVKMALWTMEESLRCAQFIAVVGEISDLPFIASRRFQLAVEQSRVTGFLLRHRPRQSQNVASIAQWKITAIPTQSQGNRPGRGFPRWTVELLKVRNAQPGKWQVEWTGRQLNNIELMDNSGSDYAKKAG